MILLHEGKFSKKIILLHLNHWGRDSIETGYVLDGSDIESRWGRDFTHPSRGAWGSTQPPTQEVFDISRG